MTTATQTKPQVDPTQIHMTFGKHKGQTVASLPPDYIKWALGNLTSISPTLKAALKSALKSAPSQPPATHMPFGKHQGKPLAELPREYLWWIHDNLRLDSTLRRGVEAVLERPDDQVDSDGIPVAAHAAWKRYGGDWDAAHAAEDVVAAGYIMKYGHQLYARNNRRVNEELDADLACIVEVH